MHFEIVVGNVATNFGIVGKKGKEIDFGKVHSRLLSGTFFVAPVGIGCTQPKTKGRLFGGAVSEEFVESFTINLPRRMVVQKLALKLAGPE